MRQFCPTCGLQFFSDKLKQHCKPKPMTPTEQTLEVIRAVVKAESAPKASRVKWQYLDGEKWTDFPVLCSRFEDLLEDVRQAIWDKFDLRLKPAPKLRPITKDEIGAPWFFVRASDKDDRPATIRTSETLMDDLSRWADSELQFSIDCGRSWKPFTVEEKQP